METKPYSIQAPEGIAKEYGGNKQQIAHAIQMGLIDPTAGLLAGMFIDRMRSAQTLEQAPQQTVAQQVFAPPAPPTPAGLGAIPPGGPAQPAGPAAVPAQPPQAGLAAAPGPEKMFNPQSMAAGGIVAFADGGESTSERKKLLMRVANDPNASREDRRAAMVELNHMEGLGEAKLSSLPDLSGMANATYEGPRGMDLVKSMMPSRAEPTYDPYMARANLDIAPEATGEKGYPAPGWYGVGKRGDRGGVEPTFGPYLASASLDMIPPRSEGKYAAPGWYGVGSRGDRGLDALAGHYQAPPDIPGGVPGAHSRFGQQMSGLGNADAAGDVLGAANLGEGYSQIGRGIKRGLGSIYDYFLTPTDELKGDKKDKPRSYKSDGNIPVSLGDYKPGWGDEPDYRTGFKVPTTSFDEDVMPSRQVPSNAGLGAVARSSRRVGVPGSASMAPDDTRSIADYAKQIHDVSGDMPMPDYLDKERAGLADEKKQDLWTALAQIGFGMAGSKSPYFAQAVGEAGTSAMPGISKAIERQRANAKDLDKAAYAAKLQQYGATREEAKAGAEMYQKEKDSRRDYQGRIESATIAAKASMYGDDVRAAVQHDATRKSWPSIISDYADEMANNPPGSPAYIKAKQKYDLANEFVSGSKYGQVANAGRLADTKVAAAVQGLIGPGGMFSKEYRAAKSPAAKKVIIDKARRFVTQDAGGDGDTSGWKLIGAE